MKANINASDAAKHITMTVTVSGLRWWNFKCTVGLFFIALGARIIGVGLATKECD